MSEAEQFALYGLPDFDEAQRIKYMTFTEEELKLIFSRSNLAAKVCCALQIAYFKAKNLFIRFKWTQIPKEDIDFVLSNYLFKQSFEKIRITDYEYYSQCTAICDLFNYKKWNPSYEPQFQGYVSRLLKVDANIQFVITEVLAFLTTKRIIRPPYNIFQDIITRATRNEKNRMAKIIRDSLSKESTKALQDLMSQDDTLLELAALKQDAKDFKWGELNSECTKLDRLEFLYKVSCTVLPQLKISQQNINYYASLAYYYNIYELRRFNLEQSALYLLCYVWQKYQKIVDNLADAFCHKVKKFDDDAKKAAAQKILEEQAKHQARMHSVASLLALFVNDAFGQDIPYKEMQPVIFNILPKEEMQISIDYLSNKVDVSAVKWEFIDKNIGQIKRNLRLLVQRLDFSSSPANEGWIKIVEHFKQIFKNKKPLVLSPEMLKIVPKSMKQFLFENENININRFEFWIYHKLKNLIDDEEIHLKDSIKRRSLNDELVPAAKVNETLKDLDLKVLKQPISRHLKERCLELEKLLELFDRKLKRKQLKNLEFDHVKKDLIWHRLQAKEDEELKQQFYDHFTILDIVDVLKFVNTKCNFLSAFTHLQPKYTKQKADNDHLLAVVIGQAFNYGNFRMSEVSDMRYNSLDHTYRQCVRLATLKKASDKIIKFTSTLPIFKYYYFDFNLLYGTVDGQKYELVIPTTKARNSKKYWGLGKGVVAYTLLANNLPLETQIIGAHEHESYYLYDISKKNTSGIIPDAISGDMHSINKANFAIMAWFGYNFTPRFSNIHAQVKHIYGTKNLSKYKNYLIKPIGKIDIQAIEDGWPECERVMATLASKEISQSNLMKKLCTRSPKNKLRKAIFEYDKLERSIYTLKYFLDTDLQRNVGRSQNRIESYHQLRAAIAQVNGRKELTGRTDIAVEISNYCGMLVALGIICHNAILASHVIDNEELKNEKRLSKLSPIAWKHIHLQGQYTFKENKRAPIDIKVIFKNIDLKTILTKASKKDIVKTPLHDIGTKRLPSKIKETS